MILYINCCPRAASRTDRLAKALLSSLGAYEELKLYELDIKPLNRESLDFRTALIESQDFSHDMFSLAKQFAEADTIVISAPFWDLSFPAQLKVYIENIYITGIVSEYGENGAPHGLCRADMLYYVTTAGGPYDGRYSYDYIKTLAQDYLGIKDTKLIKAEMLDIFGNNPDAILNEAKEHYGLK